MLSSNLEIHEALLDLLLALLLQVQFNLQGLPGLQEGLAVFAVSHVVGHDAHSDDTDVDHNVGQKLKDSQKIFRCLVKQHPLFLLRSDSIFINELF